MQIRIFLAAVLLTICFSSVSSADCNVPNCLLCQSNNSNVCQLCDPGFYLNSNNGTCGACPTLCASCSAANTCDVCPTGCKYYGTTNQCCDPVINCQASHCAICAYNDMDQCANCNISYFLNGTTGRCQSCPTFCQKCQSETSCDVCQDGLSFYSKLNRCGDPQKDCKVENCGYCYDLNFSMCATCKPGYYVNNHYGNCSSCPEKCLSCANSTSCMLCAYNLTYNPSTNKCWGTKTEATIMSLLIAILALFAFY